MATYPEPPPSPTQDNATHHTSPAPAEKPQEALVKVPVKVPKVTRELTGTIRAYKLPDSYVKHPNPVGRPKNPRG